MGKRWVIPNCINDMVGGFMAKLKEEGGGVEGGWPMTTLHVSARWGL